MNTASNVIRFRRFKLGDTVQIQFRAGCIYNHRRGIVREVRGDRAMVQVDCINTWQPIDSLRPVENWLGRAS